MKMMIPLELEGNARQPAAASVCCPREERPMPEQLRAVVIGAGWAGEGHTVALQHAGVAVEALCARDAGAVGVMAERLRVPHASTNWRTTLHDLRPDIVGLATPAALRAPVVE